MAGDKVLLICRQTCQRSPFAAVATSRPRRNCETYDLATSSTDINNILAAHMAWASAGEAVHCLQHASYDGGPARYESEGQPLAVAVLLRLDERQLDC